MLILLLVLGIITTVILAHKEVDCLWFVVLGIFLFIIASSIICTTNDVVKSTVVDEKICMYQEENTKIETSISSVVSNYINHESEVFDRSDTESLIVLIQMYPNLKSDELVKNQIEVYISNNNKIKSLKEAKINYKISKWWLYFDL